MIEKILDRHGELTVEKVLAEYLGFRVISDTEKIRLLEQLLESQGGDE